MPFLQPEKQEKPADDGEQRNAIGNQCGDIDTQSNIPGGLATATIEAYRNTAPGAPNSRTTTAASRQVDEIRAAALPRSPAID
jgi:hypothetical protein